MDELRSAPYGKQACDTDCLLMSLVIEEAACKCLPEGVADRPRLQDRLVDAPKAGSVDPAREGSSNERRPSTHVLRAVFDVRCHNKLCH